MRRLALFAPLAIPVLLLAGPSQAEPRWRALERLPGREPVQVTVEGKARVYWRLDPGAPLEVALAGPARLKVISRAELPPGQMGAASYRVWMDENGARLQEQSAESAPARLASVAGGAVVCKSRTMMWDVPVGTHRLRLFGAVAPDPRSGGSRALLVRLLVQDDGRQDLPMVSLTPVDAFRGVTLAEGEKLIPYYSVAAGKPVHVRVVGPTDLELTSRLDFDPTMRGEQSYRLQIWEAGRMLRELAFRTTKATTATYTDLRDRVASKVSRATLPIGEGTHDLIVQLAEPRRGSAEIHVRIPQPLAGAEE